MEKARQDYRYYAFISYSHQDKKWGDWLHKSLETYKVPRQLAGSLGREGTIPKRLYPIFRDREELPTSSDLGKNINEALEQSRFLIVICSAEAAQSRWVNEEVKYFKALGREDRVLCLIVDGEPNAGDKSDATLKECFPEAIRYKVTESGEVTGERTEPIAADLRPGMDGKANALLKLLAGLLGVDFDALRQRERTRQKQRRRRLALAYSMVVIGIVLTVLYYLRDRYFFYQDESKRLAKISLSLAKTNPALAGTLLLPLLPENKYDLRSVTPEAEEALRVSLAYLRTPTVLFQFPGESPFSKPFSPDGGRLLTRSGNNVLIRDVVAGRELFKLTHDQPIETASFSPDGTRVATASSGTMSLWDATNGQRLRTMFDEPGFEVKWLLFNPDSKQILITVKPRHQTRQIAIVFNAMTGAPVTIFPASSNINSVDFTPDGKRILLGVDVEMRKPTTYTLEMRDAATGRNLWAHSIVSTLRPVLSPDGSKLVAKSTGIVSLRDTRSGEEIKSFKHEGIIRSIWFSRDGMRILAVPKDYKAIVWDVATGAELASFAGDSKAFAGEFGPNSAHKVEPESSGLGVVVHDLSTGEKQVVSPSSQMNVNSAWISPDGSRVLISQESDKTHSGITQIWDAHLSRKTTILGYD
jgi:WD40 repeat protein